MSAQITRREAIRQMADAALTREMKQACVILDPPTKRRPLTVEDQARGAVKVDMNTWSVPSSSRPGSYRLVKRLVTGQWDCSCSGQLVARKFNHDCRHIVAVQSIGHHPEMFRDGLTCCEYWRAKGMCCPRSEEGKAIFRMMEAA